MKIKHFLLAALCTASALPLCAQSQGYLDGIEYYKADQFDNAREILERTLNDNGTDQATALYYLGSIALRDGKKTDAANYFKKGIQSNPKNGLNYVGLGAVALANGNTAEANSQFKAATKIQNNAAINVAIARAFYNADPVAHAKEYDKHMEAALKKDKNSPDYYIMRGDKQLAAGDVGAAAASYEMASHLNPGNPIPEAYVKYATAYINANPQFAIDKLKELNKIAPNSALAQRELAEKYYESDQLTRAAEQYGIYMQNPNHFIQDEERYVQLLFFGQNYDKSFALATEILGKNPESFSMKRMRFLNKAAMKNYDEALNLAEIFFATVPPANNRFTANDYTTYGDVLSELKQDSLALIQFETAVKVNPDKAELLKNLSSAYNAAGNPIAAAETYQRFIDTGEGSTNDQYVLAGRWLGAISAYDPETQAAERAQASANALNTINAVLEKVDNDPRIPQRKARILIVSNNNEINPEAVECYESVLTMLDNDPEMRQKRMDVYREAINMIARYYIQNQDNAKAKTYYLRMLELEPENESLRQYLEKLK